MRGLGIASGQSSPVWVRELSLRTCDTIPSGMETFAEWNCGQCGGIGLGKLGTESCQAECEKANAIHPMAISYPMFRDLNDRSILASADKLAQPNRYWCITWRRGRSAIL